MNLTDWFILIFVLMVVCVALVSYFRKRNKNKIENKNGCSACTYRGFCGKKHK